MTGADLVHEAVTVAILCSGGLALLYSFLRG